MEHSEPILNLAVLSRALYSASPLPTLTVHGPQYKVCYCNDAFLSILDKSTNELMGRPFYELVSWGDQCLPMMERVSRNNRSEMFLEENPEKPRSVLCSYSIWPIIYLNEKAIMIQVNESSGHHMQTVAMNEALLLSSLKLHEAKKTAENLNRLLNIEVREHKNAGDVSKSLSEKLATADREKDEFLAMLAHELRNPLTPIKNALQILKVAKPDPTILSKIQTIMERQVNQLVRLVDDLLDMARIQNRKVVLNRVDLNLNSLLDAIIEAVRPTIQENKHRLVLAIERTPTIFIDGDPERISQIITNVIGNAIKYTPSGGQITVKMLRDGGNAVIRVSDDGVGIEKNMLPNIFNLFTQEEASLDRSRGGLGLGLKLVKELAEMQNGTVEAFSEGKGKGSEFILRFPEIQSRTKLAAVSTPPVAAARQILLVEDNEDIAESMALMLELEGHTVQHAHNGTTGITMALKRPYDVAFIDIGLPGMNGYEVAESLRESLGGSIVLIALTGYGKDSDKKRAMDAGFNAHLTKPADDTVIVDVLNRLDDYRR